MIIGLVDCGIPGTLSALGHDSLVVKVYVSGSANGPFILGSPYCGWIICESYSYRFNMSLTRIHRSCLLHEVTRYLARLTVNLAFSLSPTFLRTLHSITTYSKLAFLSFRPKLNLIYALHLTRFYSVPFAYVRL